MTVKPPIFVALDYPNAAAAEALVEQLSPTDTGLKVGKELFTAAGPDFVKGLTKRGFNVFLDLKFHDIPNTVAKAVSAAAELGVGMVNVHASGGRRMMEAARQALSHYGQQAPDLIAVTVLTSMTDDELHEVGVRKPVSEQVSRLAALTADCGLDGVVCSAQEAVMLRQYTHQDFLLVTPGIRPAGADSGDQRRIMTPVDAIQAGVSYLVIGRPITQAADPAAALASINKEINAVR